jgi:ABC-type nitrate/sulfonate/bicarbonate transport system permease component
MSDEVRDRLAALLGTSLLILAWALIPPPGGVVPPLMDIFARGWSMGGELTLLTDLLASLRRVAFGGLIGLAGAIACGIACLFRPLRAMIMGPLELARPIPPIAWIPLMIALFGIGERSAVGLVSLAVFFPMLVSIIFALEGIDRDLVLAARSLGASTAQTVCHIYAPAMAPTLMTGARLGLGIGWFSVVAAEMVGSYGGLGYGIQASSLNLEMERFFVYFILIGLCGFAMNAVLVRVHRRISRWQRAAFHE